MDFFSNLQSETQNPFENHHHHHHHLNHRYSFDSSNNSTKSLTPVSSSGNDHSSFDESVQLLREENFDLRQHCQMLEQKLTEKDSTIRLLQQQMVSMVGCETKKITCVKFFTFFSDKNFIDVFFLFTV